MGLRALKFSSSGQSGRQTTFGAYGAEKVLPVTLILTLILVHVRNVYHKITFYAALKRYN